MLILSNQDIEKILPVGACLDVLEEAYRDLGNGMAATVPRYDVFSPTKPKEFYEYKTMSGVLPRRNVAALRLNSSVVKWYEKAGGIRKDKLPVAGGDKFVGLVLLFSTETGEPLAIFPDGYVQKLRVAGALLQHEGKIRPLLTLLVQRLEGGECTPARRGVDEPAPGGRCSRPGEDRCSARATSRARRSSGGKPRGSGSARRADARGGEDRPAAESGGRSDPAAAGRAEHGSARDRPWRAIGHEAGPHP